MQTPPKPTAGTVVVVGSLHYDIMLKAPHRPRKGETVTGTRWFPKFGGKGGNQAVAAARAGAQVRMVGAVGRDDFAGFMLHHLTAAGIGTDWIGRSDTHGSGMSVAILDAEGDYGAVIVSGANADISPAHLADPALWDGATMLILQNEIPEATNITAARAARDRGARVCLNAAPARPLTPALLALIDLLVVNTIEAEDMGAGPVTDLDSAGMAAIALLAQAPAVLVTAGAHGAVYADKRGARHALQARDVTVVSTHGAGDAFVGAFCAALASGEGPEAALTAATHAAAAQVSAPSI